MANRELKRQARELRLGIAGRLGQDGDSTNGNGRHRVTKIRHRRKPNRVPLALAALAALFCLGMVPKACATYLTSRAKITAAEEQLEAMAANGGWTKAELEQAIKSLHRRYKENRQ